MMREHVTYGFYRKKRHHGMIMTDEKSCAQGKRLLNCSEFKPISGYWLNRCDLMTEDLSTSTWGGKARTRHYEDLVLPHKLFQCQAIIDKYISSEPTSGNSVSSNTEFLTWRCPGHWPTPTSATEQMLAFSGYLNVSTIFQKLILLNTAVNFR